jgi:hypothetical protein
VVTLAEAMASGEPALTLELTKRIAAFHGLASWGTHLSDLSARKRSTARPTNARTLAAARRPFVIHDIDRQRFRLEARQHDLQPLGPHLGGDLVRQHARKVALSDYTKICAPLTLCDSGGGYDLLMPLPQNALCSFARARSIAKAPISCRTPSRSSTQARASASTRASSSGEEAR